MIRVLIDACLLVKGNVCNVLLDFGKSQLIALQWTPEIGTQFVKNWAKRRVDEEVSKRARQGFEALGQAEKSQLSEAAQIRAQTRLTRLELLNPEWRIPGWDLEKAKSLNPKDKVCRVNQGAVGIDDGDYEVALAAIHLAHCFPDDEIWLATENIRHLPPAELFKYRVWSIHQSVLIEMLYQSSPQAVEASLALTLSQTGQGKQPKLEKYDMVRLIESPQHFGSLRVASAVALSWGISIPLK